MYSSNQIKMGIKNPKSTIWELNHLYHRKFRGRSGINVMDQDWDNLLILDACRYDMFKNVNNINGGLSSVISKGSNTGEFLNENFREEEYNNTIYISANPQVQNHDIDEKFVDRFRLWETHWNEDLRTVHPSDVVDETLKIQNEYPNKRYIIHFVQPHYPFIGDQGQEIEHGTIHGDGIISDSRDYESVWKRLEKEEIPKETVWNAYIENLKVALPHVEALVGELQGKSVITSDHGNALGRWGIYGHPGKRYLTELVEVPWLVVESDHRRMIDSDEIQVEEEVDSTVEERLADLGYA